MPFSFQLPLLTSGAYTYNVLITDACGNTFTRNNIQIVVAPMTLQVQFSPEGCGGQRLSLRVQGHVNPVMVNFTSAPPGFNPVLYNSNHPGPFNVYPATSISYYNPNIPLPEGSYSVSVTDICGTTVSESFSVGPPPIPNLLWDSDVTPTCTPGLYLLKVGFQNRPVVSAQLTAAPASLGFSMPFDVQSYIFGGKIYMNEVPIGQYVFDMVNDCGYHRIVTINFTAPAPPGDLEVNLVGNCNSFNLLIDQSPYNPGQYWLQKLNAAGQWGHPLTGNTQPTGISNANARSIYYNSWNYNLQYSGTFRVMRQLSTYGNNGQVIGKCEFFVSTFEFTVGPKILDVYSFVCENGTYDAIVSATGYAPLNYKITTKNGQPFVINNNLSNIFLGLEPAIYNFQIEDGCGNILNSVFDVSQPGVFEVTSGDFCLANAWLSVPEFPFLSYEWRKGNNPAVLSTTHELLFPTFNPATDNGIYHVRVFYAGNPNSCIDYTIDHPVNFSPNAPSAGADASATYCGSPGTLDLFTLLSGNFDPGGTWNEITTSGQLTNSIWNAGAIGSGDYQFRYTVNGLCNASDDALVNIQIKPIPETPTAFLDQAICDGSPLNLLATTIPFGTYQWSGPNGFTSNEQNPILPIASANLNGTYTVKAVADGCASGTSSVEVTTSPLPLFAMESACVEGRYEVGISVNDSGIDVSTLNISWSGPDNYTGTGSPIVITGGKRGIYIATVTTADGCASVSEINVPTTLCSIPTGVSPNNDSKNDVFDLTGFGVLKFKIYNRYGRMVFEQNNYTNQWYGQDLNGNFLPDATYYYYVRLDTGKEMTGWVYVNK